MSGLSGVRVILVDDDPAQTEVVSEILTLEGMDVSCTVDLQEIERLLASPPPDVVLLDLHGVDAQAVSQKVQALAVRPAVLVLSGDLKLADHAKALGADGYLAKPYDLEDLLRSVQEVVTRRRQGDGRANAEAVGIPGTGPG